VCKWTFNCFGCGIYASDNALTFLLREPFIAVDWNEVVLASDINHDL